MPNRDTRDTIILKALDMVNLPNLKNGEAPGGVVKQGSMCIDWLQDIIDFWYHMSPFSATVRATTLNCVAGQPYVALPQDFILDVRNGYLVRRIPTDMLSYARIIRVSVQKFINRKLSHQRSSNMNYPYFYCIHDYDTVNQCQLMQITPTPSIATQGILYHYSLPAPLKAGDKPRFPNDYVCIEYMRIRALEWANLMEPGTAQKFCDKVVSGMRAQGLLNEPEDTEIPFDDLTFIRESAYNSGYGSSVLSMIGPV